MHNIIAIFFKSATEGGAPEVENHRHVCYAFELVVWCVYDGLEMIDFLLISINGLIGDQDTHPWLAVCAISDLLSGSIRLFCVC